MARRRIARKTLRKSSKRRRYSRRGRTTKRRTTRRRRQRTKRRRSTQRRRQTRTSQAGGALNVSMEVEEKPKPKPKPPRPPIGAMGIGTYGADGEWISNADQLRELTMERDRKKQSHRLDEEHKRALEMQERALEMQAAAKRTTLALRKDKDARYIASLDQGSQAENDIQREQALWNANVGGFVNQKGPDPSGTHPYVLCPAELKGGECRVNEKGLQCDGKCTPPIFPQNRKGGGMANGFKQNSYTDWSWLLELEAGDTTCRCNHRRGAVETAWEAAKGAAKGAAQGAAKSVAKSVELLQDRVRVHPPIFAGLGNLDR